MHAIFEFLVIKSLLLCAHRIIRAAPRCWRS